MSAEQELLTHWRSLPQEKQQEVLDFVEFLHFRINSQGKDKIKHPTPKGKAWMPGFFEEVIGGWVGEPLERPEQGEYETREALF
ncbi:MULTISPECIES: DUF2281 domain-containing protein [Nostoc]|uniref:DUF2281 domain-containing protein n=1 Tax=Nostoc paludosum FACHB-159 TaxID=2692908 RepID=A0ABR8KHA4_9NOSO|nr:MULTISPECIES: DUF2281 domain-containing protein [Nostoc]MBD2681731.1 DUF2281 domain-containing protein [Nostoc sp. FACHB-857]MBD2738114.1 DUF2281 domain-containing protein [Nostoc paludosum FACHB-159]